VQNFFCTTKWIDQNNFQSRAKQGFYQYCCKIKALRKRSLLRKVFTTKAALAFEMTFSYVLLKKK